MARTLYDAGNVVMPLGTYTGNMTFPACPFPGDTLDLLEWAIHVTAPPTSNNTSFELRAGLAASGPWTLIATWPWPDDYTQPYLVRVALTGDAIRMSVPGARWVQV